MEMTVVQLVNTNILWFIMQLQMSNLIRTGTVYVVSCVVILVYVILCHFLSVSYLTVVHVK